MDGKWYLSCFHLLLSIGSKITHIFTCSLAIWISSDVNFPLVFDAHPEEGQWTNHIFKNWSWPCSWFREWITLINVGGVLKCGKSFKGHKFLPFHCACSFVMWFCLSSRPKVECVSPFLWIWAAVWLAVTDRIWWKWVLHKFRTSGSREPFKLMFSPLRIPAWDCHIRKPGWLTRSWETTHRRTEVPQLTASTSCWTRDHHRASSMAEPPPESNCIGEPRWDHPTDS